MPARQRKNKRRRVTGAPATTQDPPDNCVALKSCGRRKTTVKSLAILRASVSANSAADYIQASQ